ncbi:MAG: PH domain-containing protein [Ancrocorticia sp.]|uniref:PH domain-containing protein n=1 Tax=Ancrocorticia sp. TaxID=2593684 RepID=UPI003F8E7843
MKVALAPQIRFTPVDARLVRVKIITELAITVPLLIAAATLSETVWRDSPWTWVFAAAILVACVWTLVLWPRRVRAMGYAELEGELVIKRGIMFSKLEVVPYGRMQQVTVSSGPLMSRYGLASVDLVTASSGTDGQIPAVSKEEAERLRVKLTALGQANMEGL